MPPHCCSDTFLPVRGRKLISASLDSSYCRSDTLLPGRGRKPPNSFQKFAKCFVQIPFSPGGDGNIVLHGIYSPFDLFRYLAPREGTETNHPFVCFVRPFGSDTFLPGRGRKHYEQCILKPFATIGSDTWLLVRGRKPQFF